MSEPFYFFYLSIAAYSLFLIMFFLLRPGRKPDFFRFSFKVHFLFLLLYTTLSAALVVTQPWAHWSDALIGIILFACYHYTVFMLFAGQVMRGFSVQLCITIFQSSKPIAMNELMQSRLAKQADHIKRDRLQVMLESGFAKKVANSLRLSSKGEFVVVANRIILRIWNLSYLGADNKKKGHIHE